MPNPDQLATEFDLLTARAGVAVPADRRPAILAAYADLMEQLPLLHTPRPHTAEPANVFRLAPVAKP